MTRSVDVLIVGAGVQGVTAACEAARRGLSVALVDRGDIGGAASSNSMKIAHGGLRYLQSLDVRRSLVSIRERRRLLRLAPGLVRPLPCRLDMAGRGLAFRLGFRAGLLLNDALSADRNRGVRADRRIPSSRYPVWHDALIDDTERMLLAFVHAAVDARPDTVVWTHSRCDPVVRDGRVAGAHDPSRGHVRARCVLDCTGAASGDRPAMVSMNLVVDRLPLVSDGVAVALAHPDDGRSVFVVPWRDRTIVGTWNTELDGRSGEAVRIDAARIDAVLDWLAPVHPELAALDRGSVRLVHAGAVPRDVGEEPVPSDLPRLVERDDGTILVSGVKWTTAYGLTVRALDLVGRRLSSGSAAAPAMPLPDVAARIAAYCEAEPALGRPVANGCRVTVGAVRFAVEQQWAQTLDDVLARRTGLASGGHPGRRIARAVAEHLQPVLDWTDAERDLEIEAFDDAPRFAGNVPD
ncbi:MAG: FAD-dependent oxidoreductase [Gemmatimonadota bacterium]|nr:FAD-dependent oxidoreductase [Gemmatimonadota bacterium]